MADDVLINKAASIERCLRRVEEEYGGHGADLRSNYTRQDALVLNLADDIGNSQPVKLKRYIRC